MEFVVVKRAGEETQQDRRKTVFTRFLKKTERATMLNHVLDAAQPRSLLSWAGGRRPTPRRKQNGRHIVRSRPPLEEIRRQKWVEIFENHTAERKIGDAIDVDGTTTITTIIINQSNYLPPYRPRTRIDAAANARAIDRTKEKVKTH